MAGSPPKVRVSSRKLFIKVLPSDFLSALRHCHGFMEKFIQLATDPDFQPFQWSWPGYVMFYFAD